MENFQNRFSLIEKSQKIFEETSWSYLGSLQQNDTKNYERLLFLQTKLKSFIYRSRFVRIKNSIIFIQRILRRKIEQIKFWNLLREGQKRIQIYLFDQFATLIQKRFSKKLQRILPEEVHQKPQRQKKVPGENRGPKQNGFGANERIWEEPRSGAGRVPKGEDETQVPEALSEGPSSDLDQEHPRNPQQ